GGGGVGRGGGGRRESADEVGSPVAGGRRDRGCGRRARGRIGEDLSARRDDEGVDPDHVALVPIALDGDDLPLTFGGRDRILPGEVLVGRIDAGRRRDGLP